ncbi:MAG: hypothetical protein WA901_09760 [Phormidesmis sp.]
MSGSHDSWYQQRYGSAQVNKRQRQLYTTRTAHYDRLKEMKQEKRQAYQESALSIFAEHGITYEVRGSSWLCEVNDEQFYYWPKSGRWRMKGKRNTYGSFGALDFIAKVYAGQQRRSGD